MRFRRARDALGLRRVYGNRAISPRTSCCNKLPLQRLALKLGRMHHAGMNVSYSEGLRKKKFVETKE